MRRDARVNSDDFFEMVFDTYHDQRNGYNFAVNPNGVKYDATLGDEGKSYNPDWDGIWDCQTQISDEGWFAEMRIPFSQIRYANRDEHTWGLHFYRVISRKQEPALTMEYLCAWKIWIKFPLQ